MTTFRCFMFGVFACVGLAAAAPPTTDWVRTAKSGPWSDAATWEGGAVPGAGARVLIRPGHAVVYDMNSDRPIRSICIGGRLSFAPERDTRLDVGLIKVQPGDMPSEDGFDCDAHLPAIAADVPKPALEVGTPDRPITANVLIRLVPLEGLDEKSCPAIVCCGGRMEFHGTPMNRTWVKLGGPAKADDTTVSLAEQVTGWRVGDRVFLTATTRQNKRAGTFKASTRDNTQTEERVITAVNGTRLTFDKPLAFDHRAEGDYRGEVANLSRNVVVESADPAKSRGHTMYHRGSAGSISYAEFRHLGKPGVLGRYSLHFHLCGDTMRGSSVIGASIWDSGNRWLTIHGTNYLVVRDCVGYQSQGHGFFLEDGTEVFNVLDRSLAVQAYTTKPLPEQVLPFDRNDGSGFWWANSLNSFTRNVAAECDEYGYFFQAIKSKAFDTVLPVTQPDGSKQRVDVRTLPFVRFEDNEAHCQRRHSFNLGGGVPFGKPNVDGVGPDERHPLVIHGFRVWNAHWAIHPVSPSVLVDGLDMFDCEYAVWRPVYVRHSYRHITMDRISVDKELAPEGKRPVEADYPRPLEPTDDLPPTTVITHVTRVGGKTTVRGTTADNGEVRRVVVNGREGKPLRANFAEWEVTIDGTPSELSAYAEDAAGNREPRPHIVRTEQ
jgi:G8 domain